MELQRLVVDHRESVCRVTLTGAPMDRREASELGQVARELVEDRAVRAVVLDSAAADFCPGPAGDLDVLAPSLDPTAALAAIRVPVMALLHGSVSSVGLEIALVADLRIAAPGTRFLMPDVAAGRLPAWGGTQRLPRAVGAPEALRMLLMAEPVDAARAAHIGLVHEVTEDPAAFADTVLSAWLARGPLAMEYAKEAVLAGSELPVREGLGLEADLNSILQASADRAEGVSAFLGKRSPQFTGR